MMNNQSDDEMLQQAIAEYEAEVMDEPERTAAQSIDRDNQFKFYRELLNIGDSRKIGNVTAEELGHMNLSLRGALKVANLAKTLGLTETERFYKEEAEIMASTSMSRKATFLNLIFTQIKKTVTGSSEKAAKKGWFNLGKGGGENVQV